MKDGGINICNTLGDDGKIIGMIQTIREENNVHWMDLLRLAFRYAPKESKELMRRVADCDQRVNELTRKLAE